MFDIKGKKVILTGGVQGLGLSMVKAFQRAGADIAVIDVSRRVHHIMDYVESDSAKVYGVQGDLLDENALKQSFQKALTLLGGRVDILVNNAGLIERNSAFDHSIDSWNKIMGINVTAVFQMSRLAAHEMKKQGSGKIINMGSIVSVIGAYHSVAYSTSKGAVLQLTKSLSNEWAAYGIQVNAIAPGYMRTSMNENLEQDPVRKQQVDARIPAKRWGRAEDVTGVALFLASPASNYVTGTLIPVDGGALGR